MGWLDRWFDSADWPQDRRLDPFRDAVFELRQDGQKVGWLTTSVTPMRSFPLLWVKQEQMWTQIHWAHGGREYCEEDYGPEWYGVAELQEGRFSGLDSAARHLVDFDANPVLGSERDHLWELLEHGREPHDRPTAEGPADGS